MSINYSKYIADDFVKSLKNPKHYRVDLYLSGTIISNDKMVIFDALKTNRSLHCLGISNLNLSQSEILHFSNCIVSHPVLKKLDLSKNCLEHSQAVKRLFRVLKSIATLKVLNVANTRVNVNLINDFIKDNDVIKILYLQDNGFSEVQLAKILESMQGKTCIEQLYLGKNSKIEIFACEPLCCLIRKNSINVLSLQDNKISENVMSQFLDCVESNSSMHVLDISNCEIGSYCEQIGLCLQNNRCLTSISVSRNKIGYAEIVKLFNGLINNNVLTNIDLSHNLLDDNSAIIVADYIKSSSIAVLNLSFNTISCAGCIAIVDSLMINNSLKIVDLSHNCIGLEGLTALDSLLKINKTINKITVAIEKINNFVQIVERLKIDNRVEIKYV